MIAMKGDDENDRHGPKAVQSWVIAHYDFPPPQIKKRSTTRRLFRLERGGRRKKGRPESRPLRGRAQKGKPPPGGWQAFVLPRHAVQSRAEGPSRIVSTAAGRT